MRTLNNYIKESLLDDEEDLANDDTAIMDEYVDKINEWMNLWMREVSIKRINKNKYPIEIDIVQRHIGKIHIEKDIPEFMQIIKCKGDVEIGRNVTNLRGTPKEINGGFMCAHNNNIISLINGPQKVKNGYICSFNDNLKSLEGAPKKVPGNFSCSACKNLTDLVGGPKEVGGDYICSYCDNLKTLKGCAKKIGWNLQANNCPKLTDIKDAPEIPGQFILN